MQLHLTRSVQIDSLALPPASAEALAHSARLCDLIRAEIAQAGGWLSFERYMQLALYAPGLGYYSAGVVSFGEGGDFVTAPDISPLFARTLVVQAREIMANSKDQILELGAGNGMLAADLLRELEQVHALPSRYFILEPSAPLRERQRATLRRRVPELLSHVEWLTRLPDQFRGLIIGNEVLDALPVHLLAWRKEGVMERGVIFSGERLGWQERPTTDFALLQAAQQIDAGVDYVSEIGLAASALTATLVDILEAGAILLVDYGFGHREYYHPQRSDGTLMCHYRQRAHADPFFLPGLQDVTTHVNFSAVAQAATGAGADLLSYTSQAQFLINCGITDLLAQTPVDQGGRYFSLAAGVQKLTSPAEMGELFKVIAFGKSCAALTGFRSGDRRHQL